MSVGCGKNLTNFMGNIKAVGLGASDFLLLTFGAVMIFVLIELKRMLFERYSYRGLDVIIMLSITWTVLNYCYSLEYEVFNSMPSRDLESEMPCSSPSANHSCFRPAMKECFSSTSWS